MNASQKKDSFEWFKSLGRLQCCGIFERWAVIAPPLTDSQQSLSNTLSQPTGGCPVKFIAAFKLTRTKGRQIWNSCNPMGSCKVVGLSPKTKSACHIVAADWWISNENHGHIPTDASQRRHALEWLQSLWLLQSCGVFELWATIPVPDMGRVGQKQNLPTTSSNEILVLVLHAKWLEQTTGDGAGARHAILRQQKQLNEDKMDRANPAKQKFKELFLHDQANTCMCA